MTASGRWSRSDSLERQEGFALPGESVRLHLPGRSRGVAGAPAERGAPHAVGAGGKTFPPAPEFENKVSQRNVLYTLIGMR